MEKKVDSLVSEVEVVVVVVVAQWDSNEVAQG